MRKAEFIATDAYRYNCTGPIRWVISHVMRYKGYLALFACTTLLTNGLSAAIPIVTGRAFDIVLQGNADHTRLFYIALGILSLVLAKSVVDIAARVAAEFIGKRVTRDARDEVYLSLLGKSQTFHNRQRVGDLMARATNDVSRLSDMIVPGIDTIVDSFVRLTLTLVFIGLLQPQLLFAPVLFIVAFLVALRAYSRMLNPIAASTRTQFGDLNADLTEALVGIDVVKATAQEDREERRFLDNAQRYRDLFVNNGRIQACYLPPLLLATTLAGAFLHGVFLISRSQLSIGNLVSYMGLVGLLSYPASISNWAFNLVQTGLAGAQRILHLLEAETEVDEHADGYQGPMCGEILFENVSFGYGDVLVLNNISFRAAPGQTIAIVGQTGAGKSTLTKLVNRIYDVSQGRILIDGIDVRAWSLHALRSQVSTIEQDVVLFSRSIAENIAFGVGQHTDRQAIEQAAKGAQAHTFITRFKDGYETVIGERGITLSGGQRQRVAIARALLTDPRILILDDATSAIDSATEDDIQRALRRLLRGRTTLLITHRLSQIRRADHILVLRQGRVVDQGTHAELLTRCALYRRMFVHSVTTQEDRTHIATPTHAETKGASNEYAHGRDRSGKL